MTVRLMVRGRVMDAGRTPLHFGASAFFDRMRAQTIQTFTHLDRLKDDTRHLSTRLAAAAVFSANDPWTENGWLFQFVRHADAANLQGRALSFGRFMESLAGWQVPDRELRAGLSETHC
jgi:hypothetical protein